MRMVTVQYSKIELNHVAKHKIIRVFY